MNEKKKILIIEDDAEMIDLIKLILENEGYDAIGVMGGKQGLERMYKENPDLVLLDIMMPEIDGWEVFHKMKSDEKLKSIPVIIVTARSENIEKIIGLHVAKVDDYITKPFGIKDITSSIKRVLSLRQGAE